MDQIDLCVCVSVEDGLVWESADEADRKGPISLGSRGVFPGQFTDQMCSSPTGGCQLEGQPDPPDVNHRGLEVLREQV